jgi:hypothetical protein
MGHVARVFRMAKSACQTAHGSAATQTTAIYVSLTNPQGSWYVTSVKLPVSGQSSAHQSVLQLHGGSSAKLMAGQDAQLAPLGQPAARFDFN